LGDGEGGEGEGAFEAVFGGEVEDVADDGFAGDAEEQGVSEGVEFGEAGEDV